MVTPPSMTLSPRARFLKACHTENTGRPPVWLMRQAGRFLPEYRALREKQDFMTLLKTEELITEVSLQPWRRLRMDAVIVFADILLLPHVMGMDLKFLEGQGPKFSKLIAAEKDLNELKPFKAEKDIPFLLKALHNIRKETGDEAALIGFAGSPWTVASYILASFDKLKMNEPALLKKALERLTEETIAYLSAQIGAGVDAIQIFDSWGGVLSPEDYKIWSAPYIREIVAALKPGGVPIIVYVKESLPHLEAMLATGADVLSVGWETPLEDVRKKVSGKVAIQGNFNPHILMQATPAEIGRRTQEMLETMRGCPGYIANLGHGILPKTPVENVAAFVKTVKAPSPWRGEGWGEGES